MNVIATAKIIAVKVRLFDGPPALLVPITLIVRSPLAALPCWLKSRATPIASHQSNDYVLRGRRGSGRAASASRSAAREVMPSLGNTWYRCADTVLCDIPSRSAICLLLRPAAASRATSRSWGVSAPGAWARAPAGTVACPAARSSADRKSTRLNSSHVEISYAVFCLKKKKKLDHNHRHPKEKQTQKPN